ncbi:MAG: flagellar biosynthesis protein FlhF [Myxococcota bacterium]|jgi:flagellar biosynthesis protein FlhF
MNVRTFRATTMREAMAQVKAALGSDAVIINTRELGRGKVELVAATDYEPPEAQPLTAALDRSQRSGDQAATDEWFGPDPELLRGLYTELSEMRREMSRLKAERTLARRSSDQWDHLMEELKDLGRVMGLKTADGLQGNAIVRRLVVGGVEATLARTLVGQVCVGLPDHQQQARAIADSLQSSFEPAPAIWDRDRHTVAALVGPTGVGKTTTVAKIAAQAALGRGMSVGIIAADTFRIGAVDQVRTYAELLDIPCTVAGGRDQLRQALNRFSDKDLVLVDTTGGNPWRDATLEEMDDLLGGLGIERHLCVPASASGTDLGQIVERYGTRGIRSLVVTKMDEARHIGGIVSTVWGTDFQIAHVTTGQQVPGDIETPDPARLSQAVLG